MKKIIRFGYLPTSTPRNGVSRRCSEAPRSRVFPLGEKSIHAIPVLVLFCFLTLCWFSHPVDLVIKDGGITVTRDRVRAEVLAHVDRTQIELDMLKFASSPIASVPRDLNNGDGTEAEVSKCD